MFRVDGKSKAVQLGYTDHRYLTFGNGNTYNAHENGQWGVEHWEEGEEDKVNGLNFWRPWPLWNAGNYFFYIGDFGQVGINMRSDYSDWVHTLQVRGKVIANGQTLWSDERLKENIKDYNNALQKITQLQAVSYNYRVDVPYYEKAEITDDMDETKRKTIENDDPTLHDSFKDDIRIGFLAQDLEKVIPEIVETNSKGMKAVDYTDLIPVAIQAIKEQQEQIEQLKAEMENIKALNSLVTTPENIGIKAVLYQNEPNPFDRETVIKYNIDSDFEMAELSVYDFWGNIKATHKITVKGAGTYTLQANTLEAGTYHYSLVINNVVADTRIMFIKK